MAEDPQYKGLSGRFTYSKIFLPLVDFCQLPLIGSMLSNLFCGQLNNVCYYCQILSSFLRLLRFEKFTKAFTIFDNVIRDYVNVLGVTAFSSMLLWILFSAILYYTERDNPPNGEMANFFNPIWLESMLLLTTRLEGNDGRDMSLCYFYFG